MKAKTFKRYIPLFVLLALDVTLIVLDLVNFYRPFENSKMFQIETNDSYAEDFQNVKWLIMIVCVLIIALFKTNWRYLTWVLVFIFLFLEDVFRIHHGLADFFYHTLRMGAGQRSGKIIELFAALVLGVVFLAPVVWAYKNGDALFRKHSKAMAILLVLFLFCAIILDQVHRLAVVNFNWKYNVFVGILEDGGELITESLLAGYLLSIALKDD